MTHMEKGTTWHLKQYQLLGLESQPGLTLDGSISGTLCLSLEGPWLFVIHKRCVIENINLLTAHENLKGTWNSCVLMFSLDFNVFSRQFNVDFLDTASASGADHCKACVTRLQKYFKIFNMNGSPVSCEMTLPEAFKHFVEQQNKQGGSVIAAAGACFPDNFPVEDALKLIVADPGFGPLVARVQRVFESLSLQRAGSPSPPPPRNP
ncbi:uncharacterized protein LOC134530099 isoform X1 [Bacillus rossius redtenbacheri]|uniref:uncharacterized protein LOC134530099 isoform X1 n=1 Tax=Bacillus rossius redtenbacheri TaxID=93214 RepID=UPI002FDEEEA3